MIKMLTSFLGYGAYAEIALVIFAVVFIAIVVRTLRMKSEATKQLANIVLDDLQEGQQ